MNWVIISVVIFFSSALTYIFVRKGQLTNIPNIFINLAMFLIPAFILFFINLFLKFPFLQSFNFYLIAFFTAILLSYLGNIFSLKGIKEAPNPGYSLIISKSFIVMTSILSVFLFKSPLTITKLIAIMLIIGFSGLIVINKTQSRTKFYKKTWIVYTFLTFFCFGFIALISKYVLDQGVPPTIYLFYLYLFASIAFIIHAFVIREKATLSKNDWMNLIYIGLLTTIFNVSIQIGYVYAPNPGYINAVNAASISLVAPASAFLFKDELSLKKLIGIFGVLAGLLLLFF